MSRLQITLLMLAIASPPVASAQEKVKRVDWTEKRIVFEMRDKKWSDVIVWFVDQAQMPFSSSHRPSGTFTFIPPKGPEGPRKYSLVEIFDIINEGLSAQKWILLRGEHVMTLVPGDEDIPIVLVPRVPFEDLSAHGRTEIVEVVLTLRPRVDIDKATPELIRLFGQVTPLKQSNKLILRASVGSLVRNRDIIDEISVPRAAPPASCEMTSPSRGRLLGRLLRR